MAPNLVEASSHIQFEFLNAGNGYQRQSDFPWGSQNKIVISSKQTDLRKLLPIEINIRVGDQVYSSIIPDKPEKNCQDQTTCSIPGPIIYDPGNKTVEISAIDKDDNLIVYYKARSNVKKDGNSTNNDKEDGKILETALNLIIPAAVGFFLLLVLMLMIVFFRDDFLSWYRRKK